MHAESVVVVAPSCPIHSRSLEHTHVQERAHANHCKPTANREGHLASDGPKLLFRTIHNDGAGLHQLWVTLTPPDFGFVCYRKDVRLAMPPLPSREKAFRLQAGGRRIQQNCTPTLNNSKCTSDEQTSRTDVWSFEGTEAEVTENARLPTTPTYKKRVPNSMPVAQVLTLVLHN